MDQKAFNRSSIITFYAFIFLMTLAYSTQINFAPDAYYYFEIAKNISTHFLVSFDETSITTGFHPLWMLVCSIVYKLSSSPKVFHLSMLVIQTLLFVLGHFLLLRSAQKLRLSTSLFLIFSIPVFFVNLTVFQSGVENALLFFLISGFVFTLTSDLPETKKTIISSSLLSLSYLCRLDSIFLIATFLLYFNWTSLRKKDYKNLAMANIIIASTVLTHWLIMYFNFDTILPTTAYAIKHFSAPLWDLNWIQRFSPEEHILTMRIQEILALSGISRSSPINTYVGLSVPATILIALISVLKTRNPSYMPITIIGISASLQLAYYALMHGGFMRTWYFTFWFVLIIFGFALLASNWLEDKLSKRRNLVTGLCVFIMAVVVVFNYSRKPVTWEKMAEESRLLNEFTSDEYVLIGFSPDRAAFFSDANIRDMQGLVNDYDYLRDYLIPGHFASYVRDVQATHLVISNNPHLPEKIDCSILVASNKHDSLAVLGKYVQHNSYIAIYKLSLTNKSDLNLPNQNRPLTGLGGLCPSDFGS